MWAAVHGPILYWARMRADTTTNRVAGVRLSADVKTSPARARDALRPFEPAGNYVVGALNLFQILRVLRGLRGCSVGSPHDLAPEVVLGGLLDAHAHHLAGGHAWVALHEHQAVHFGRLAVVAAGQDWTLPPALVGDGAAALDQHVQRFAYPGRVLRRGDALLELHRLLVAPLLDPLRHLVGHGGAGRAFLG